MEGQAQEPVTFEDVMVSLSRAEWDVLTAGQRELYRDVVSDTYELLTSLGYPGPKPDVLHRLERGEEPWICSSPEHSGSWLEEPPSDWWPGASGYQGLETLCSAEWSTLQDRSFLENSGCHERRSKLPSRADNGVGCQTQPWFLKEEMRDKPELMENLTQSETFPLPSMPEQQSLDPWEQLWADLGDRNPGNAQNHGHTLGEATLLQGTCELSVEDLRAAVAKDHGYCLRSEPGTHSAPGPCSLQEHDYCWQHRAGKNREPCAGSRQRSGKARRARGILRRYQPFHRSGLPRRGCSGSQATTWTMNLRPREPREPQRARNAQQVTSDTGCAPEGILGTRATPPAPSRAARARKRAKPLKDSSASREVKRSVKAQKSQQMSLQDVFRDVLKAVGYILDSMCQKFELQGLPQEKSIWPIVIQIDNVAEIRKDPS